MARDGELIVTGYREFLRACAGADKAAKREVREILREVGNIVKRDATRRFEKVSPVTAAGYRTVVRQRGIAVEQSIRKTTGRRPDYGAKQMRDALLPSLAANTVLLDKEMEHAVDLIADVFEYGSY